MHSIFISIVIVCKDNPRELNQTLDSLATQNRDVFEVVIVDGSGSDACHKVSSEMGFDRKHIVEEDGGVYPAMNKGITRSAGESILFLNSGDRLHPGFSLAQFVDRFRSELRTRVIICRAIFSIKGRRFENTDRQDPVHQAIFFPAAFCNKTRYDESMKICADALFLGSALDEYECLRIADIVCEFELGGLSTAPRSLAHVHRLCSEMRKIGEVKNRAEEYLWIIRLTTKMLIIKTIGFENQFLLFSRLSRRWREIPPQ